MFLCDRRRVDDSRLYVRNAVHDPDDRPLYNAMEWGSELLKETRDFSRLLGTYAPPMVFTFGAFAFEFARRSLAREPRKRRRDWTTRELGMEFARSVKGFDPRKVNVFPLLHVSIARGHFLKSHENFTGESSGNCFDFVAKEIAFLLLKHKNTLNVWVGLSARGVRRNEQDRPVSFGAA